MAFIALEGGEGVGKTTQRELLKERLPKLFPVSEFMFTREPGGSPFAEQVRELILGNGSEELDGKTMFGLFAAARADHLRTVILPNLAAAKVVITDRFAAATFAYQVCAMKNPISSELFWQYYRELDAAPDVTIILDVDPAVSQARVRARSQSSEVTHFDTRPPEFHEALRAGYQRFARSVMSKKAPMPRLQNQPAVIIDASQSVEKIHADILEEITKRFSF